MTTVIHLTPDNAVFMNNLKGSIAWMKTKNEGGKYDLQIGREQQVLQNVFDEVLGRNANDNSLAVNAA